MTKPPGRAGRSGSSKILYIRLDSCQQHELVYKASRERGISVNSFCLAAVIKSAIAPGSLDEALVNRMSKLAGRERPSSKAKPRTKEEVRQALQSASVENSDPFDLISLKQLERIAVETGVEQTEVFRIIQMFIDACG